MLKKNLPYLWSMRREFIRYLTTGISAMILDIATLYLLKEYLHLRPVLAVVINQIFLFFYIFFLHKYWSFKSNGVTRKQMARFLMLAGLNYAISVSWMWFFNEMLKMNYLLARISCVVLAVSWNFFLYRGWVYKQDPAPATMPPVLSPPAGQQ